MNLRANGAVAFAFANLYLLFLTGPLVSPQHQLVFHLPGSATSIFAAVIADVLVTFAVILLALCLARRSPAAQLLVWAALLLPLPFVLVQTVAAFSGQPASAWLLWSTVFVAAAGLSFTVIRARPLVPVFLRVRRVLTVALTLVSLSAIVLFAQLLWFGWKARDLNPPFVARASAVPDPAPTPAPRIVWIILDELSFRQVYGHRFPGLALANFDSLAAQSTLFTHAFAAAEYTRIAVPSLLTGSALSATSPTAGGRTVLLHPRGTHHWNALQPQDTVFGDVARTGLQTGVAGWYEPYCRILPGVLNYCFWTYSDNIPAGLSGSASALQNAVRPLRTVELASLQLAGIGPRTSAEDTLDVQRHGADYRALLSAGDNLLRTQPSGLIYLHMPIPHPWGFYDRRTDTFPNHRTSYLDNLALADAYIGHVRSLLQQNGQWDNTTLIVMGDHGWRTRAVWMRSGFWTPEEHQAQIGSTTPDPPAMIVKLAGQHTPARIDAPFQAFRTRALVNALVHGQIRTPDQLSAWVQAQAALSPRP